MKIYCERLSSDFTFSATHSTTLTLMCLLISGSFFPPLRSSPRKNRRHNALSFEPLNLVCFSAVRQKNKSRLLSDPHRLRTVRGNPPFFIILRRILRHLLPKRGCGLLLHTNLPRAESANSPIPQQVCPYPLK